MGNTSQCTFLSNNEQQFRLLAQENHFLYGDIHHFLTQKPQQKHFAIKKIKFSSQSQLKKYKQTIQLYQQICTNLHLTKASLYVDPQTLKQQRQKQQQQKKQSNSNQEPLFQCNKHNFIFKSPTEELSCSQPCFIINLNLQYLQEKNTLRSNLIQKSNKLIKALENNKINQNILIELQSKVKLFQYKKIDNLPHKERSIINLFFTEIQALRILDSMLTSLYGLKINGFKVNAVRPELFFTSSQKEEISYFFPEILEQKIMGNFQKSHQSLKKWLDEQKALFHHNWSLKEREYISYVHPENIQKLSQILVQEGANNFIDFGRVNSKEEVQRQSIFSLGLMMLQICLLEPFICCKLYTVSICKSQQKKGLASKKEIKYSFDKDNLTIKFNYSVLQKYLIQMKTRYSDEFVDLVEFMLFGGTQNTSLVNKTAYETLNFQTVIQKLSDLIEENVLNLKEVYNESQKSKSKAKQSSQKQSRKSSLTKQVSYSNVSNPSLSSSSSLSIFPVQTQQKIYSVELLKNNCSRIQNKVDKILMKSQLQTLHESFAKKQTKLQNLISKDQERILSQLNQLNTDQNINRKQKRFGYRKIQDKSISKQFMGSSKPGLQNSNTMSFQRLQLQTYGDFKLNTPASLLPKMNCTIQQKQKRFNSSSKIKKNIMQKAKQEQSMGNSICQTIFLYKQNQKSPSQSAQTVKNTNIQKIQNSKINMHRQVEPFSELQYQNADFKSQLKNLMMAKDNKTKIKTQTSKIYENQQQKSHKLLKSNELYQIYLKQYKNLVQSQRKTQF